MNLNQEFQFSKPETQLKMFNVYNTHFTGSSAWRFNSDEIEKFYGSYNMNIKVIFDLPWPTRKWICEALVEKHMKVMIYSRYVKFLKNICLKSDRDNLKSLLNIVKDDVRSQTGSNIKKIFLDTGIRVVPGVTLPSALSGVTAYKVEEDQRWRLPLLLDLLRIRDDQFEIRFDEEHDETLEDDDISAMIFETCTS